MNEWAAETNNEYSSLGLRRVLNNHFQLDKEFRAMGYNYVATNDNTPNMYRFQGKPITHEQFLQGLQSIYGKGNDW